jgi:hypothetical protein
MGGCDADAPVLLASRSASLMRFAARLLFHPCRNVLATDLDWPAYRAVLAAEAAAAGRAVTNVRLRDGILSGRLSEGELIDCVCERYAATGCDGLYLTAVSNLGVRFPVERVVRRLEARHAVRAVVVDGAQEFGQFPTPVGAGVCDLYLAGSHKWLSGYHPLGIAFYGRRRSRGRVETILANDLGSGAIDDPLLRFVTRLEAERSDHQSETVSLAPLFSAQGAVRDATGDAGPLPARLRNREAAAGAVADAGWAPLTLAPEYRTGVLLVQAERRANRERLPDALRASLRDRGIAATTYPDGLVRLSMPAADWRPGELAHLCLTLKALA